MVIEEFLFRESKKGAKLRNSGCVVCKRREFTSQWLNILICDLLYDYMRQCFNGTISKHKTWYGRSAFFFVKWLWFCFCTKLQNGASWRWSTICSTHSFLFYNNHNKYKNLNSRICFKINRNFFTSLPKADLVWFDSREDIFIPTFSCNIYFVEF